MGRRVSSDIPFAFVQLRAWLGNQIDCALLAVPWLLIFLWNFFLKRLRFYFGISGSFRVSVYALRRFQERTNTLGFYQKL